VRSLNLVVRRQDVSPLRSKEQLDAAEKHLDYEYFMLVAVAQAMASGIAHQDWLTNALLESFVIHFRSLVDFLYPPANAKEDDVLSTDYFEDPTVWERIRPPLSDLLRGGRVRAHKEIAHLTYARLAVTPETKPWAYLEIAREVHELMVKFKQAAGRPSS
jgi:hypothetical protein